LFWIGLLSPSDSGVQRKSDSYLDSGSGVKKNRTLTCTRALKSKGKSDSSLDSGSGVRARSDSGLDSGSWFARAWDFAGGYRHFSAGIGIGKGQPPPQEDRKGAGEVNGLTPPPPPLAANYSDVMQNWC
jgi:hypothetical protein